MSSNASSAQGTQLKRGDGGGTEVFTSIGEITDFSGPGGKAKVIDKSTLDSVAVEKLVGLPDEGTLSLTVQYDSSNTQHTGLKADRAARTRRNFKLALSTTPVETGSFAGYVTGYTFGGKVDDKLTAKVDIEIDGPITWA